MPALFLSNNASEKRTFTYLSLGWWAAASLSVLVGSYSIAMLVAPGLRSPFVANLIEANAGLAFAHFGGSATALLAGIFQLHRNIRVSSPRAHQWLGRLYLVGVALGSVSGGMMAVEASGGVVARWGFASLTASWALFTSVGYFYIRKKDVSAHGRWMMRSFALTFGAVTLRVYLPASLFAGVSFEYAYPIMAWLSWLPNLAAVEIFRMARHRRRR